MQWYLDVLKKYVVFDGRAGRPEFWWFALCNFIVYAVLFLIGRAIGSSGQLLAYLYDLAVLLPSLGVAIRRLHDTNRSGWWVLLGFVVVIGWIVLIVFYASRGTAGSNRYGAEAPTAPA
jgi:uncharacterized membrane protein YhaH (DUF805 family)